MQDSTVSLTYVHRPNQLILGSDLYTGNLSLRSVRDNCNGDFEAPQPLQAVKAVPLVHKAVRGGRLPLPRSCLLTYLPLKFCPLYSLVRGMRSDQAGSDEDVP